MNTRTYHLEDAARLAMGNFMIEERVAPSWSAPAVWRIAIIATAIGVSLMAAWAYLA